jgi:eukaryotic-like serine/threonine-protein kinase
MRKKRIYRIAFALIGCCLALFMTACGSAGTTTATGTPVAHSTTTPTGTHSTPTPGSTTVPVPATSTSCPAAGTARAGVFAHLARGNQANIVYIVNQNPAGTSPGTGTLKRYAVATGAKTEIINLPNTLITEAQLSADGQWILFIAQNAGMMKLQLVRMDGQGLQTLTCSTKQGSIFDAQWSTNQHLIVFAAGGAPNVSTVELLNVATGELQVAVTHITSVAMYPRTWLDNTRVYLVNQPTDEPPDGLYLLDTSRGANQSVRSLQKVFDATAPSIGFGCWSFDSSYDGKYLFTSQCIASDPRSGKTTQLGSSAILVHPATGGSPVNTVFSSSTLAITSVRAMANGTLLYTIDTIGGNSSQNGLWKINPDGSYRTQLSNAVGQFNQYSQYPWSNISRDGSDYVLQLNTGNTYTLLYGSLSGGSTFTFASIADGTQLATVGWTTI